MSAALALALLALAAPQQPQPAATGPVPTAEALANDTGTLRHAHGRVPPVAHALRVTTAPRIDGRLDDAIWSFAVPITGFVQQQPVEGAAPSESTAIRIAYDDDALYIAARMYDRHPELIASQLSRRDNIEYSDGLEIDIDSYHDHQTSFVFQVSPAGVRGDGTGSSDFFMGDFSWDPVWEVATTRDSLGWTAEVRIPLSQLRFNPAASQVWGMNFMRYITRNNEMSFWSYRARTDPGFASYFGHVFGFDNLPQPRRLELLPYVTAREERLASGSPGNPFDDGSRERLGAGLDVQYGVTSNLTLNATFNPDFGQVEQDPAVVNLSAYETFLEERRPFFVAGANIFRVYSPGTIPVNGPQLLDTRRIGRAPQLPPGPHGAGAYVDVPEATTILGAAKVSGRPGPGWTLGAIQATTAREFATTDSAGARRYDQVEPLTNYAALRLLRDAGGGATTFGLEATAVNRDLNDSSAARFLRRAAYAGGLDFSHRFAGRRNSMFAYLGGSVVTGSRAAIGVTQLSSARYYQRPDAHGVRYDPARTSLAGWYAALGAAHDAGPLTYAAGVNTYSPGYEINDFGYQSRVDRITLMFEGRRQWTTPGRVFRSAHVELSGNAGWNFDGDRVGSSAQLQAEGSLANYWNVGAYSWVGLAVLDDALLRGGPVGAQPASANTGLNFSTDYRRKVQLSGNVSGWKDGLGGSGWSAYAGVNWRPAQALTLSAGPSLSTGVASQQYVRTDAGLAPSLYGARYLFGKIRQRNLDLTTRFNVIFSPELSLQLYAQPFVATGRFDDFRALREARTTNYLVYGVTPGSTDTPVRNASGQVVAHALDPDGAGPLPADTIGNPDFSYRSLRGNAVLRWEYRPGSTLYLVWTQSCSAYGPDPAFDAGRDLARLCQGRGDNVFGVKLNWWISR